MLAASGKANAVAQKRTQTEWDLSSSATGTVKRRPSSLESCKSNSPTESAADFPVERQKADSPSIKKRILKLPESARKSISTKLKLPSAKSKLSLTQLEQKNNLFIRDGQQQKRVSRSEESDAMEKSKKSLIPSFLNAKPHGGGASSRALSERLTKTSHKFKELCQQQNHVKKPPPYRPPPVPPSTRNYEEIEPEANEHDEEENAKGEYSKTIFENIPVRQRKGNVSHMENYCLFDPSVDFCNEKDLSKKATPKIPAEIKRQSQQFVDEASEERIEDITFDDQTLYDISEHDERGQHHNYYEIDPELLEQEEAKEPQPAKKTKKIYSNALSSSSESTSASQTSGNSNSSSSSSSDYPSLFNSVIETTHSSTIESTDDNDSNGYGKVTASESINQQNADSSESVITVQSVTACGESGTKKKSPQLNRIIRPSGGKQQPSPSRKSIGARSHSRTAQFDPLKQSHSLPQLQRSGGNKGELSVVIDSIQLRRPHNSRPLRPLSTHSDDRDSGFLSPATPPDCHNLQSSVICRGDGRTKTESTLLNQCDNIQQMIEIYTQWANYYLERAKSKRKVADLSTDCRDGLLLAEVIEAVTNFKVPDLIKKPKTQQQMFDNVEACLTVLKQNQIGGLETITANDICAGRLKAVLSLFFSLSRYKQSTKLKTPTKPPQQLTHQAQIHHQSVQSLNSSQGDMTKERQLPVPQKISGNGTAIPTPATVLVTRRSTDKSRGIPVPNGNSLVRYPSGTPSSENSRPSSPPDIRNDNRLRFSQNAKLPPSPYNIAGHEGSVVSNGSAESSAQASTQQQQQSNSGSTAKHSMLDKLKLFNKDKERSKSSKRTSSSSGFSSARSDSSLSLNNDPNATSKSKKGQDNSSRAPSAASSAGSAKTKLGLPSALKSQSKGDNKKEKKAEELGKLQKVPTVKFQQQQQQQVASQNDLRMKQQMVRKIEIRTDMQQRAIAPPQLQPKAVIQPITTSIPKPMAAIKGTQSKMMRSGGEDELLKEKHSGSSTMSLNGMSPLHNQLLMHAASKCNGSSQSMAESLHSANHSNSSESSVIYRPSASESEFYMQQTHRAHKFNTIPSKLNGHHQVGATAQNNNQTTIFEETKQQQQPLRSIMRNYNNNVNGNGGSNSHHVTLPTRGARSGQNLVNGYYEDHNQGYCSDGDALRKTHIRYTDIENGYLSEGGGVNGNLSNPHLMSIFRNRPQLPMTIAEERCRTSKDGNLESPEMDIMAAAAAENWHQREKSPLAMKNGGGGGPKSRVKGVPQNFGYVKKCNGSATASEVSTSALAAARTTATVSAVPRTNKLGKVSGGTQTTNNDFQQKAMQSYKSYSLTGAGAAQMSQSIKDRLAASRASSKLNDGSLSDTYSDIKDYSAYSAMWLRHSNTSSRLSDGGESVDGGLSLLARNQRLIQHRNSAQSPGLKLNRSNSISYLQGIRTYPRSTKSEKTYPSMLSRAVMPSASGEIETEPYYCLPVNGSNNHNGNHLAWSQPTSPTPRTLTGLISPTHTGSHRHMYHGKKNDEVHGSQISLMSGGSSMYGSTTEEQRQANEVRRLKRELTEAREQVMSLSSQLSTNAHVVNAFEKSLATMTNRLQTLTAATEKKESEITEMRQTIELLKKQSIQAGLTSAHIESMGVKVNGEGSPSKKSANGSVESGLHNGNGTMQRQLSTDSVCSINSLSSNCSTQDKKKKKGWLRSSFTKAFTRNAKITKTSRQGSLNGTLSESKVSLPPPTPQKTLPKMPTVNTIASDLGKPPISPTKTTAQSRQLTLIENAKPFDSIEIENHPIVEELKKQLREKDMVLTDIRLEALTQASQMETLKETVKAMRAEMMALKQNNDRLQKIMTHRSLAGSENSLGCPASPCSGGGDSRRYSFATDSGHSRPPLDLPDNLDETEEEDDVPTPAPPAPLSPQLISEISPSLERMSLTNEILTTPIDDIADAAEGKRISIAVYLGHAERFFRYMEEMSECERFNDVEDGLQQNGDSLKFNHSQSDDPNHSEAVIAFTYISGKTTWQNLDYIVRKTFKDYLGKIDPGTNLGLNTDSISSYHLGEAKRGPEMGFPELLPCGYIIGSVKTLHICLQGVSSLAFDTLVPRSIVHRYINLLTEHRRLILCGPKGTGKSYLARKLAEFLVAKSERASVAESIATFNVDHKSSKDLQHYLSQIAEQASINASIEELPAVIILDNLHHASELGDVFSCLLSAGPASKLPCIIGTMSQATCNTTNLQLHHNFRWVLTANHMEPVKGFLGRFLRRRLYEIELQSGTAQVQMEKIYRWLPSLVQHINSFLETHSSSDVTIGPQQFLECPLDVADSQNWFLDLWNNNLAPYMIDAIKEGVQLYGKRGNAWTDPCLYIRETYPWPITPSTVPKLKKIEAQDVGLEESDMSNNKDDPLLNMLNQLKEAASWNEIQQQDDSDCVSLDSNFTHDSSVADN